MLLVLFCGHGPKRTKIERPQLFLLRLLVTSSLFSMTNSPPLSSG